MFVRSPTVGAQNDPPPHGQLVTTDLTGGNVRVVTSIPAADPVLSPNGRTVLFDHRGGIWAVPIGFGKARRVVRDGGFPDFSPDGRSIVHVSGAKQTLHVSRADGAHPRRILGPTRMSIAVIRCGTWTIRARCRWDRPRNRLAAAA